MLPDLFFFFPVLASFTFYLADPDDRELTPPTASEDSPINSVSLDPQLSGTEPEDGPGALAVSGIAHDGFVLSWNLTARALYDSFAVEFSDIQQLWDVQEVLLPGDATGASIRGLKALTEYQIKLSGVIGNQRSALLEAVAVTGIRVFFTIRDAQYSFLPSFVILCSNVIFFPAYSAPGNTEFNGGSFYSISYSISAVTDNILIILCIPKPQFTACSV